MKRARSGRSSRDVFPHRDPLTRSLDLTHRRDATLHQDELLIGVSIAPFDLDQEGSEIERMQLSSEKYAFPIDNSPDTILLTRLEDGLILDVNDDFSRNTGYARDEAIGKSTSELDIWVNRARRQVFVEVLKNRGECLNFESEFRAKDGRIVPSLVSAKLTEVDGEACVFSISRNISDLKLAEEKLRQSEAHFRTVVESLGEGVLITDKDDVVLYMNPRMTDLTGYTPEEMLGKPAYELLLPPEKWPTLQERNRQRATGVSERYEAQMLRKDRSLFWAEVYAAPYRNSDGEIVGTLGAMIDTTERKHLEEQLRQSQRMEALGQLTAGIAHNFNNVLQGIMGNLDIALMDAPYELKPSLLDAERTSRRGADIVRQLMLFTRSGGPAESQPVDINQVLGDTVAICRRTFDRRISITLGNARVGGNCDRGFRTAATGFPEYLPQCPRCSRAASRSSSGP